MYATATAARNKFVADGVGSTPPERLLVLLYDRLLRDLDDADRAITAIEIPAAGAASVEIPVRLRWSDVPGLFKLATNRDELQFKVSGVAAVASTFGDIDVPFSRTGKFQLSK